MLHVKLYNLFPLSGLLGRKGYSERSLAGKAGLSRLTIRSLLGQAQDSRLSSWSHAAEALESSICLVSISADTLPEHSIQSVGFRILQDGEASWKIHLMNFVDEFRRNLDTRLILLPPPQDLSKKVQALIRSTVYFLSREIGIEPPLWSKQRLFLDRPWFVSESEVLKPSMILESPLAFRQNNIFVGENFLERA